jgi:hypothetical protein
VRVALHAGPAEERGGDYYGPTLNCVDRLVSAGHGGQILLTRAVLELIGERLPPGVESRDLGERRLRDITRPERIYQVVAPDLPSDFPPLRTLDLRPNNLPAFSTSFIGRERQVSAICALLRRADVRLLTLTGAGGTGKTRLARQVAADLLDDFEHGVFFVPLADSRICRASFALPCSRPSASMRSSDWRRAARPGCCGNVMPGTFCPWPSEPRRS